MMMASMSASADFKAPFIQALLLHAALISLFSIGWQAAGQIEIKPQTPKFLSAKVVSAKSLAKKQPVKKAASKKVSQKKKAETEAKKRQEKELARKKEQQKKAAERKKAEAKRKDDARKQAALKKKAEAKKKELAHQETLKKQRELELQKQRRIAQEQARQAELAESLAEEQAWQQAQEDDVISQSYVDRIKALVTQAWNRPPSARNEMQVYLRINLVPTGEVISASVIKSSGNLAFDRSAEQAVLKVGHFEVPKESRIFEKNFRQFTFLFNPGDLRR